MSEEIKVPHIDPIKLIDSYFVPVVDGDAVYMGYIAEAIQYAINVISNDDRGFRMKGWGRDGGSVCVLGGLREAFSGSAGSFAPWDYLNSFREVEYEKSFDYSMPPEAPHVCYDIPGQPDHVCMKDVSNIYQNSYRIIRELMDVGPSIPKWADGGITQDEALDKLNYALGRARGVLG